MSAARWVAMAKTLTEAGYTVKVSERAYPGGVSRSITIRTDSSIIEVSDTWWRKNLDVWTGYAVWRSNLDSIVTANKTNLKSRADVRRAVDAFAETS
jgi:hypothetical protein